MGCGWPTKGLGGGVVHVGLIVPVNTTASRQQVRGLPLSAFAT